MKAHVQQMRMLALLLSQPPLARGFVFMSDAVYRPLYSYVWDTPLWDFNTTSRGFGAGLAYAVRPSFCDRMLPHFQEGSAWVNCKLLNTCGLAATASMAANEIVSVQTSR